MQKFEQYLQKKRYKASTIKGEQENLARLEKWAANQGYTSIKELNYREILHYMQTEKNRGLSKHSINIHLNTLTKYYDYLIEQEEREDNPAKQLRIKKQGKRIRTDRLSPEQLDELYKTFKEQTQFREYKQELTHKRNIIVLGLMIHQAISTGEFKRLETSHINLDQGSIYIPSTSKSKERELKLHTLQIMPLFEYLTKTRTELLKYYPVAEHQPDRLISGNISNLLYNLFDNLRKNNPYMKNLQQIRSSIIMEWVKHHNIRKVQYMAGHKYISSTEQYQQEDIESLQKELNKLHPLK